MTSDDGERRGPLSGVRVADFSRVLAGPYATMMLADFGADVVKIEPPAGDDTRSWTPPVDASGCLDLLRRRQSRQALGGAGPDHGCRPRRSAATGVLGRRRGRELPTRRDGSLRPRLRGRSGSEPRRRLLLDHRLRGRRRSGAARVRPARPGGRRAHERDRSARRRPDQGRGRPRRRAHRAATRCRGSSWHCGLGTPRAVVPAPLVQVDLLSSLLSGLVNQASSTLATGVAPGRHGQRAPEHRPVRVVPCRRPRPRDRRGQRPAVRGVGRGARRPGPRGPALRHQSRAGRAPRRAARRHRAAPGHGSGLRLGRRASVPQACLPGS